MSEISSLTSCVHIASTTTVHNYVGQAILFVEPPASEKNVFEVNKWGTVVFWCFYILDLPHQTFTPPILPKNALWISALPHAMLKLIENLWRITWVYATKHNGEGRPCLARRRHYALLDRPSWFAAAFFFSQSIWLSVFHKKFVFFFFKDLFLFFPKKRISHNTV